MSEHATKESKEWQCWVCHDKQRRVICIEGSPSTYYCEACLFNAVRDGDLAIGTSKEDGAPNQCDRCETSTRLVYCKSCAQERWSESESTCVGCGNEDEPRCLSCAREYWDLHDTDDCDHDDCHDDCNQNDVCGQTPNGRYCYNETAHTFCRECMQDHDSEVVSMECEGCSKTAVYHYCAAHDPHTGSGVAASTPKTGEKRADISDDGSTVTVDGITIQF